MIETTELERRALTWPEKAKQTMIEDQVTYDRASAMLLGIKDLRRDIDLHYDPLIAKAYAAHKTPPAAKKKIEAPLAEAETILKTGISRWHAEQERARQELERKAREESEHLAEEIRLEMAVQAEESGAPAEVVQEMLESSISLPAPVAAPTYQKADGISTQRRYRADVTDIKALCRAVADGEVSPECVVANMTVLNSMARSLKETLRIPGVRAVFDDIVSARTK